MLPPSLVLSTLCLGCLDHAAASSASLPGDGGAFAATVVCVVDVAARTTSCTPLEGTAGDVRLALISDARAVVQTGFDAYTAADSTYRLSIRLANAGEVPLGTRDGSTISGITAYIPVNIMGFAGRPAGDPSGPSANLIPPVDNKNNLARARNPDGRMALTGPDQPFWRYQEALGPGEASQWREWRFTLDPGVSYFYFAVNVIAAVPGEPAVPVRIPDDWTEPARYRSEAALRDCRPVSAIGRCIPDAVVILFDGSATQEERQAAIEAAGGILEGGHPATNSYYVRIAADTTLLQLRRVLDVLRRHPRVRSAVPYGPVLLEPA